MSGKRRICILFLFPPVFLLAMGTFVQIIASSLDRDREYVELAAMIETCLMRGLVSERHLPHLADRYPKDRPPVAYILGGTQDSIGEKIKVAGRLFRKGEVNKVFVLHRPGITEYSPPLGRNFTNDEWATVQLGNAGIPAGIIEFVPVPNAAFDTYSEAKSVSALARARRLKRLVLVSSMHHTERVRLSFSHFNGDNAIEPYIYGSEEKVGILELLKENVKLRIYKYFVFPIDRYLIWLMR